MSTSTTTDPLRHWTEVWSGKTPSEASWYQEVPQLDSELVRGVSTPESHVVLVGVGVSTLVADLLSHGYQHLQAVDVSAPALEQLSANLGRDASRVRLRQADARSVTLDDPVEVWHDRAVFHFLVDPRDRAAYAQNAARAVQVGGHLIIATFGPAGPERCSGLAVERYDGASLAVEFAASFDLVATTDYEHITPWGSKQPFTYAVLRRRPGSTSLSGRATAPR